MTPNTITWKTPINWNTKETIQFHKLALNCTNNCSDQSQLRTGKWKQYQQTPTTTKTEAKKQHQKPTDPTINTHQYPSNTDTQTPIEQQETIQTTLNLPSDNIHWGNPLHPVSEITFRILSKNINSLSTNNHFIQWQAAAAVAQDSNTNVLCLQETNLCWENNNHQAIQQIFWKSHEVAKQNQHVV